LHRDFVAHAAADLSFKHVKLAKAALISKKNLIPLRSAPKAHRRYGSYASGCRVNWLKRELQKLPNTDDQSRDDEKTRTQQKASARGHPLRVQRSTGGCKAIALR